MTSFDPWRDPVAEIDDVLLITASAGSGKTWMISHLAARWLLEGGGEPHELLMVTFSRAAAAELRARLRRRLREVGRRLAELEDAPGSPAGDEELRWLTHLADSLTLPALRARHREVVAALDVVHARTIHSFAAVATGRDESTLTDARQVRRAAAHESVTRAVTTHASDVGALIDHLEDGTGVTPGGVRLATMVADSLATAASAGGHVTLTSALEGPESRAVGTVFADAGARARELLAVRDAVTFDDLINDLAEGVADPASALADRLRAQFRLVLIDEFQDTDAQQWRIFDTAFRRGDRRTPLVLVGDPKQAIYGFRGGDVSVLERVRSQLAATSRGRELALTVNYRSTAGLLDALNALFGASDEWRFGDATDIGYEPVVPRAEHAGLPGRLVLRTCDDAEDARRDVVATVRALLGEHGVAASDVAILCRTHTTATEVRVALERAGVATATIGGGSVFATAAATHLRTLLWVLLASTDPRRLHLLAATWFAALGPDDVARAAADLRQHGVAATSRTVLGSLASAADAVSERDLTDVEHLLDVLGARHRGPVTPDVLIAELDAGRVGGDEEDVDASARRRVESDRDAVRVMTIHAAKGLQFPVVLIPQVESHSTRRRLESWTTDDGRTIDVGAFLGAPHADSPYRARAAAEDRRLMYVALTRAERLCVAWVPGERGQWPQLVAPVLTGAVTDPSLVVAGVGGGLDGLAALDLGATAARASGPPRYIGPAPRWDESGRRWSYSALRLGTIAHADDAGDADDDGRPAPPVLEVDADPGLFDGRRGAALGVAVHRALELLIGTGAPVDRSLVAREAASAWRFAGLPTPSDAVVGDLVALLERPLGPLTDGAPLCAFGRDVATTEMRFTLPLPVTTGSRLAAMAAALARLDPTGPFVDFFTTLAAHPGDPHQLLRGYLTGSLDLVLAVGAPARYVVIDYKTNLLAPTAGYEPPALVDDMVRAGYPVQALLYAVALHRFLRGRVADYDPDVHLGGVGYLYVRGAMRPVTPQSGLALWRPPSAAVVAASDICDGRDA